MGEIKFLCTDLDGTLLNNNKELPCGAEYIFSQIAKSGIKTALITTRPYRRTKQYEDIILPTYTICNNGAEIYKSGKLIYSALLDDYFIRDYTSKLMAFSTELIIGAEADGKLYGNYNMIEKWNDDIIRCDFPKFPFKNASKIIISAENSSKLVQIASYLSTYSVHIEFIHGMAIITASDASKSAALKKIASLENISLSECAAFGNDAGDVEMLKEVGHPFCVENSENILKEFATVLPSNANSGVTFGIKKYILGVV